MIKNPSQYSHPNNQKPDPAEVPDKDVPMGDDCKDKSKPSNGDAKDGGRASRKLLANAQAVPDFLSKRWPLPPGVALYHTTHVDSTLPLFQIRLLNGVYEGKQLGLTSTPLRFFRNLEN